MVFLISGRRDSNSRHSAWKAEALPTELLPQGLFNFGGYFSVGRANYELRCASGSTLATELLPQGLFNFGADFTRPHLNSIYFNIKIKLLQAVCSGTYIAVYTKKRRNVTPEINSGQALNLFQSLTA